jgi:hypothetical protein
MHDDCIAVYRGGSDVMFFVVGDANEVATKNYWDLPFLFIMLSLTCNNDAPVYIHYIERINAGTGFRYLVRYNVWPAEGANGAKSSVREPGATFANAG